VLVGLDDMAESLVAAAQARCVSRSVGRLEFVAIAETQLASHAGFEASHAAEVLRAQAREELALAEEIGDPDDVVFRTGSFVDVVCAEARSRSATLVVCGEQSHGRLAARLLGGRDLPLLRRTSASLLVARAGWGPCPPRRILAGVDGSAEANVAEAVARELAARIGSQFTPLIALGEGDIDHELVHAERTEGLVDPRRAVDALTSLPDDCLVVIGSSATPGAVTTHVAHEARSSVLVVRAATAASA
jgi:nucleotide-binding universal stress UspA family protein